jgi:L-rhamnose mutarotase
MTEVALFSFHIKPGRKVAWLKCCDEVKNRREEVVRTLKNEGVVSESCFLSKDETVIYYYMEAENLEKAYQVQQSKLPS